MKVAANGQFSLMYRLNDKSYAVPLKREQMNILNHFLIGLFNGEQVKISKQHEIVLKSDYRNIKILIRQLRDTIEQIKRDTIFQ